MCPNVKWNHFETKRCLACQTVASGWAWTLLFWDWHFGTKWSFRLHSWAIGASADQKKLIWAQKSWMAQPFRVQVHILSVFLFVYKQIFTSFCIFSTWFSTKVILLVCVHRVFIQLKIRHTMVVSFRFTEKLVTNQLVSRALASAVIFFKFSTPRLGDVKIGICLLFILWKWDG